MGPFKRFRRIKEDIEDEIEEDIAYIAQSLEDPGIRNQAFAVFAVVAVLLVLRHLTKGRIKTDPGERVVNLHHLNNADLFKEVFLAYLNAALLEPLLAIGGMQKVEGCYLIVDLFTAGSICWWIWLITDAFSFEDITAMYRYQVDLRAEAVPAKKYPWLKLQSIEEVAHNERITLAGSYQMDVALWFMLACIGAAFLPGPVSHRDVLHAHVVVFLWIIMHHICRKATSWGNWYLVTFFFPSSALMPMEYCLPLMDAADTVEDLEFVGKYREFVAERTGVELIIEA